MEEVKGMRQALESNDDEEHEDGDGNGAHSSHHNGAAGLAGMAGDTIVATSRPKLEVEIEKYAMKWGDLEEEILDKFRSMSSADADVAMTDPATFIDGVISANALDTVMSKLIKPEVDKLLVDTEWCGPPQSGSGSFHQIGLVWEDVDDCFTKIQSDSQSGASRLLAVSKDLNVFFSNPHDMTLIVEQMIQRKFEKVPAKGSELGKILPLLETVEVNWTIIGTDLAKMEQDRAKQAIEDFESGIEDHEFGDDATKTILELVKFVQEKEVQEKEVLGRLLKQLPGTGWINRVAPILAPKVKEALLKKHEKYEGEIRGEKKHEKEKKKRLDELNEKLAGLETEVLSPELITSFAVVLEPILLKLHLDSSDTLVYQHWLRDIKKRIEDEIEITLLQRVAEELGIEHLKW
jgi:hypothetical protein